MTPTLFLLTAHTNLHVGSGDANFGIIDNLVQRDVLTKYPTIHESGLKGALKEYFSHLIKVRDQLIKIEDVHKKDEIKKTFGNSDDAGNYRFYGAHLLTFPVRTNQELFLHASTPRLLADFLSFAKLFEIKLVDEQAIQNLIREEPAVGKPFVFTPKLAGRKVEHRDILTQLAPNTHTLPQWLTGNEGFVLFHDTDFSQRICGLNQLPVVARNALQDGRSVNLWYEEMVPRQTRFYALIQPQDKTIYDDWFFDNLKIVQVGANASIGQGLLAFSKLQTRP
ncbi:type III-B CRISPR module RAMP protein Cmr4 [Larkinella sp. VNQ87]|uniref:type III-B CRISPR module RAMP protein Cmr4 n=1 Tax=Larkinella sp. VNQ87 TaxID=3400921 RepID=UPI003C086F2C